MPLPELPILVPEQTLYRHNIECASLSMLLLELHAGVKELGVGACKVVLDDDPKRRTIGYSLISERGEYTRQWDFCIRLTRLITRDGGFSPNMGALIRTVTGRQLIAERLEAGDTPTMLGDLTPPEGDALNG